MPDESDVVVVLPTYNEAENLESMVAAIRKHRYRVLVVDDNSPDGSGDIADRLSEIDPAVGVLHRADKAGLGRAYGEAFGQLAGDETVEIVCQIDADFSHDPADLPRLVGEIRAGADLAIGSRYVPGGSTPDWPVHRRLLSVGGNGYAKAMLGLGVHDCTAGFRAWRASALYRLDPGSAEASGYGFQVEMTGRAVEAQLSVREVPIAFRDRQFGESKMGFPIVLEAMWLVTRWGLARVVGK